jgi:hypothetical protein
LSDDLSALSRRIVDSVTPDLGPHTAQQALQVVCKRAKKTPATLGADDLELACEVLGRMLRTLLGRGRSDRVVTWIRSYGT